MTPRECTAVVVTRGDLDLDRVIEPLADFGELLIWNNRLAAVDQIVWGRYLAATDARHDAIYVQDDDTVVDAAAVVAAFDPAAVVCNMPQARRAFYRAGQPTGMALVGWGAVFHRSALSCFGRYFLHFPIDDLFRRECDRVFTALNPIKLVDVAHEQLPAAYSKQRMGAEERHLSDLEAIRRRVNIVTA